MHLAIKNGTNLALMNALLYEIIASDWIDHEYAEAHTMGFDSLKQMTMEYLLERAAEICGVSASEIREAARIIGSADRLLSTVLQGLYQSHQATAACQMNNIHLLRGMIGQAAQGARDRELLETVNACEGQTATQIRWIRTRMEQAAPQVLLVAS